MRRKRLLVTGSSGFRWMVAVAVGALLPTASQAQQGIYAQVHDCDILAADPYDRLRMVSALDGHLTPEIAPLPAQAACAEATAEHPQTGRFVYQLGRAYASGGDYETAQQMYRQAAGLFGHAAAFAGLGELYLHGWGVTQDLQVAREYYLLAVDYGYYLSPDMEFLLDGTAPNLDLFKRPDIIELLASGRWSDLEPDLETAAYLSNFRTNLQQFCFLAPSRWAEFGTRMVRLDGIIRIVTDMLQDLDMQRLDFASLLQVATAADLAPKAMLLFRIYIAGNDGSSDAAVLQQTATCEGEALRIAVRGVDAFLDEQGPEVLARRMGELMDFVDQAVQGAGSGPAAQGLNLLLQQLGR